jgi:hypothetical protein
MFRSGCESRQVLQKFGGASRARTDGLVVANDALSQLSYSPTDGQVTGLPIYFTSVWFFGTTMRGNWYCLLPAVRNK